MRLILAEMGLHQYVLGFNVVTETSAE